MRIPTFDAVVLGILIVFAIAWPVFFTLIRRGTRGTGRGTGWCIAAFLLGPIGAPVVFLLWRDSIRKKESHEQ